MKRILLCAALLLCGTVSAQDWGDLLKKVATEAADKVTGGKLTEAAIAGCWNYAAPAVKFEGDDRIVITISQRSSVESAKLYAMQTVESVFALAGAEVVHSDGYPGWTPDPESKLLEITVESYRRLFDVKPKVRAIHAGLECGLFMEKLPGLDAVSLGPELHDVHSVKERLSVPSTQRVYEVVRYFLERSR